MVIEPVKRLEEMLLDDSKPDRMTRIGTLANLMVHQALTTFLKDNWDVFTWSHEDMSRINLDHGTQTKRVTFLSTHPSKETGIHPRTRPSYNGRSSQAIKGEIH